MTDRLKQLEEALRFYADYEQYDSMGPGDMERSADYGRLARQVLGIPERPEPSGPAPEDCHPVFTGEVAEALRKTLEKASSK